MLNQHLRNIVRAARLPHPKMETRTDAGSHLLDAATFALYQVSQTPCFRCLLSISPAAEQLDICARPIAPQFPQDPGRKLACNLGCSKGKQYLPTNNNSLSIVLFHLFPFPQTQSILRLNLVHGCGGPRYSFSATLVFDRNPNTGSFASPSDSVAQPPTYQVSIELYLYRPQTLLISSSCLSNFRIIE